VNDELTIISGKLPARHRAALHELGAGNLSEGLRLAVDAGLAHLAGGELPSLLHLQQDLQIALRKLERHATGTLPSGARWFAAPDELPDPGEVHAPAVFATPAGVLLIGAGANLLVDAQEGEIVLMAGCSEVHRPMDMSALLTLSAQLPSVLVALASGVGPRVELSCGLHLERDDHGLILGIGHLRTRQSALLVWQLAAEVLGLATRSLANGAETRIQLEQLLERDETPREVVVHD
jgi:hypothetical protein